MGRIQTWRASTRWWLGKRLPYHLSIGKRAERLAEKYLLAQGLALITRNFHCKHGEIDLIMAENQTLVFVEVRLRIDNSAQESVTLPKQRRIIRTAGRFLTHHPAYHAWPMRFDIIAMDRCRLDAIEWLTNAFGDNY